MLSLLKKKSENAAPPAAWHPNLRVADQLPDTKVVRTAFFINGVAATIALALALYMGQQEWQNRGLNIQIAEWQRQIGQNRPMNDQGIALYNRFKAEAAKSAEVEMFIKSKPILSEIILRIAQTLPVRVAVDSLDFRDTGITLRITVRGAADQAAGDAAAYLDQLRRDKVLAVLFSDPALTNMVPDALTGRMTVELLLQYRKEGEKK